MESLSHVKDMQPFLQEAWKKAGFKQMTPIQEKAIPLVLQGEDLIAESPTGTGKTLAYLLPILQRTSSDIKNAQALILVPTRELAMQIHQEIQRFTAESGISGASFVGGADMKRQVEKLKKHPQIVVGTPGRIKELIDSKKLKMHEVKAIVVDELDQLIQLKLMNTVEDIVKTTLRERQLLFFSATISDAVVNAVQPMTKEAQVVRITAEDLPETSVEHIYFVCERRDKVDVLRRILKMDKVKAIAFVQDSIHFEELASKLQFKGISLGILHGQSWKTERETVMKNFRDGKFPLLLATDLAARGLDIEGITHVIHFDFPADYDQYIHRSGRTGRMGAKGTVISLITEKEESTLQKFSKKLNLPIKKKVLFSGEMVDERPRPQVKAKPKSKPIPKPKMKGKTAKKDRV